MTPKFMYTLWKAVHLCSCHDKASSLAATVLESTMQPCKQTYLLTSMASTGTASHIQAWSFP